MVMRLKANELVTSMGAAAFNGKREAVSGLRAKTCYVVVHSCCLNSTGINVCFVTFVGGLGHDTFYRPPLREDLRPPHCYCHCTFACTFPLATVHTSVQWEMGQCGLRLLLLLFLFPLLSLLIGLEGTGEQAIVARSNCSRARGWPEGHGC